MPVIAKQVIVVLVLSIRTHLSRVENINHSRKKHFFNNIVFCYVWGAVKGLNLFLCL